VLGLSRLYPPGHVAILRLYGPIAGGARTADWIELVPEHVTLPLRYLRCGSNARESGSGSGVRQSMSPVRFVRRLSRAAECERTSRCAVSC
jgi:hypothetical protein